MNESASNKLTKLLPILGWITQYKSEELPGDFIAGIVVAIMLVPQSMAYAMLAGLPPETGLYASIVPLVIYALFGSSKVLAVGPVAMVSLLTASGISPLAEGDPAKYIALAVTLALLSGVIQLIMGLARFGFLVNYLSHPVLVGFTSAAALVIGASQLKHLFGIEVGRPEYPFQIVGMISAGLSALDLTTFAIGTAAIVFLLVFGKLVRLITASFDIAESFSVPISKSGPLIMVFVTILLVWHLGLNDAGVKIVGEIPSGIAMPSLPVFSFADFVALLPIALIISLVGFTESISIATTLGSRKRQKIDADQELIALGAANIGAAFSNGYPVTGGLSRSAVNFNAGANSGLSSIITASLVGLTALFLTPLFYFLPKAALAAVVVVAVAGLFDYKSFLETWKYNKTDAFALLATFVGVLGLGIEIGIAIDVVTALLLHLHRTSTPHIAVVGRVGDTEHFRNVKRHKVQTCPGTHAVRIDESLYFANTRALESCLLDAAAKDKSIERILLICNAVNVIDSSALDALERVIEELEHAGVELYFSEIKGPVMDRLLKVGFFEEIGEDRVFLSTHDAFRHFGC